MRVKGVSPDGKKAVEFESELIGREFIDRMVNFDLSEDDIRKRIDRLAVSADVKSLLYSFLNPCCLQRVPAPRAPAHDFSAA